MWDVGWGPVEASGPRPCPALPAHRNFIFIQPQSVPAPECAAARTLHRVPGNKGTDKRSPAASWAGQTPPRPLHPASSCSASVSKKGLQKYQRRVDTHPPLFGQVELPLAPSVPLLLALLLLCQALGPGALHPAQRGSGSAAAAVAAAAGAACSAARPGVFVRKDPSAGCGAAGHCTASPGWGLPPASACVLTPHQTKRAAARAAVAPTTAGPGPRRPRTCRPFLLTVRVLHTCITTTASPPAPHLSPMLPTVRLLQYAHMHHNFSLAHAPPATHLSPMLPTMRPQRVSGSPDGSAASRVRVSAVSTRLEFCTAPRGGAGAGWKVHGVLAAHRWCWAQEQQARGSCCRVHRPANIMQACQAPGRPRHGPCAAFSRQQSPWGLSTRASGARSGQGRVMQACRCHAGPPPARRAHQRATYRFVVILLEPSSLLGTTAPRTAGHGVWLGPPSVQLSHRRSPGARVDEWVRIACRAGPGRGSGAGRNAAGAPRAGGFGGAGIQRTGACFGLQSADLERRGSKTHLATAAATAIMECTLRCAGPALSARRRYPLLAARSPQISRPLRQLRVPGPLRTLVSRPGRCQGAAGPTSQADHSLHLLRFHLPGFRARRRPGRAARTPSTRPSTSVGAQRAWAPFLHRLA